VVFADCDYVRVNNKKKRETSLESSNPTKGDAP
jgi:hypothetical protein